jgi:hypothetical protein
MKTKKENQEKLVSVAEYTDLMTAHIVAQRLIAGGIEATVVGGQSSYPALNVIDPVCVMVLEEDEARALELLDEPTE